MNTSASQCRRAADRANGRHLFEQAAHELLLTPATRRSIPRGITKRPINFFRRPAAKRSKSPASGRTSGRSKPLPSTWNRSPITAATGPPAAAKPIGCNLPAIGRWPAMLVPLVPTRRDEPRGIANECRNQQALFARRRPGALSDRRPRRQAPRSLRRSARGRLSRRRHSRIARQDHGPITGRARPSSIAYFSA